jgi:hypothetical protein
VIHAAASRPASEDPVIRAKRTTVSFSSDMLGSSARGWADIDIVADSQPAKSDSHFGQDVRRPTNSDAKLSFRGA